MPGANRQLVYVVDEDEIVRDSLKALIESHGYGVRDFATDEKFLLTVDPSAKGCIVLGFSRCSADAVSSLRKLRKYRSSLPIIFVVGPSGASSKGTIVADGAFAQFERPIRETVLIRAIQRAVASGSS